MSSLPLEGSEVVLVHGYPGSGRGTQCKLAAELFGFTHLSVGDLMRKEMNEATIVSKLLSGFIMEGRIAPAEVTCSIIKKAMEKSEVKRFLIDGYPRSQHGLNGWKDFVSSNGINVKLVLQLNCSKKTCKERIFRTPGASGRSDDDNTILEKRINAYEELMSPIQEDYKDIWKDIDGEGREGNDTPKQIFERVKEVFEKAEINVLSPQEKDQIVKDEGAKKEEDFLQDQYENTLQDFSLLEHVSALKNSVVVLVQGYPGAGKGTQCELIAKHFGFTHISVGDLMRKEMRMKSVLSEMVASYVLEGKVVPVEITSRVLKKYLIEAAKESETRKFLIDGHPRDERNLEEWEKLVEQTEMKLKFVLQLNCDKENCRKRILENEREKGRLDDSPEILNKRFETYENLTNPIQTYFKRKQLVREIDGEGKEKNDSIKQVFERLKKLFEEEGFSPV